MVFNLNLSSVGSLTIIQNIWTNDSTLVYLKWAIKANVGDSKTKTLNTVGFVYP